MAIQRSRHSAFGGLAARDVVSGLLTDVGRPSPKKVPKPGRDVATSRPENSAPS